MKSPPLPEVVISSPSRPCSPGWLDGPRHPVVCRHPGSVTPALAGTMILATPAELGGGILADVASTEDLLDPHVARSSPPDQLSTDY